MATKVSVPLLGEGVEEVTIVNWLKSEGEAIEEFEGLVEVETDKVVTEIPSPADGTILKINFPDEGVTVPVGGVLAWIGSPGEPIPDEGHETEIVGLEKAAPVTAELEDQPPQVEQIAPPTPVETSSPILSTGRNETLGFISPLVSKIASEHNVDLSLLTGTGLNGRITKNDLLQYLDSTKGRVEKSTKVLHSGKTLVPGTILPLTTVRRRIADHMVLSKRTSAHVTTLMEADFSRVAAHRSDNKALFAQRGVRLTFTAYIVSATIEALKTYPLVNSSWSDDGIILHKEINIGMATDLGDEGLIVPVIKDASELSLLGISKSVNDLADRARAKKLSPDDVQGATFSITNHGVSGSLLATPIINQPQCAILGVGLIEKRVVVVTDNQKNESIAIRPMAYLTLTFDHRILDGAGADHFLAKVIETIENW